MTQQAVSSLAVFALLGEEPPVDGHSARVTQDRLAHADEQKEKENVEDDKEDNIGRRLPVDHKLEDEHEVVECDE